MHPICQANLLEDSSSRGSSESGLAHGDCGRFARKRVLFEIRSAGNLLALLERAGRNFRCAALSGEKASQILSDRV
jgi:hypothetical protein